MYKLTVTKTGTEYTIPKENIGLLAFTKARDMGAVIDPRDSENAIKFLEGIGISVEDYENE